VKGNNGEALVVAAAAGQGIVYVPTFLVSREILAGKLEPLRLDQPTLQSGGIYACYPSARRPPAKVRAFIDFMVECLSPEPHWDRALGITPARGSR
jgi:DNA-binding transcriptional LysR family regulator